MQDAVVELDGVVKRYGATTALAGVSLRVARNQMFGVIGPDGAGKTTMIRVMAGLLRADRGRVVTLGRDPSRERRRVSTDVGYLSQRFSLYGDLSIDENIAFFAEIHGMRDYRARRDRLLAMTQLTPFRDRLADRLSGGMRQKLALACTLVHEPRLILLDEPTSGVDPVSRREFWKLLSEFLAQGLTIVMATPYLDEAERCARVALLHEGRLMALDDPSALRREFPDEVLEVVAPDSAGVMAALQAWDEAADVQSFGERAHLRLHRLRGRHAIEQVRLYLAGSGLEGAEARAVLPSLEDVFIERILGQTNPQRHGDVHG